MGEWVERASPDLCLPPPSGPGLKKAAKMDAIRKKMQSMKFDIDALYQKNAEYEEDIRQSNAISDQFDIQIRDTGKKVQKFETTFEEILEKMTASAAKMDEAEKEFKDKDDDVNAAARRCVLMEGEATVSVEKLATTEMKSDNLARSLAMMEDELKRAEERVKIAEERVVKIEDELSAIGENQKQLEISEEKARRREEKYQDQIKQINIRLKESDSRSEYAEMNITKLHLRIDELEDEIIREKLKINAVSGQLDDTFNEMLNKY